jgi:hypothetical protein
MTLENSISYETFPLFQSFSASRHGITQAAYVAKQLHKCSTVYYCHTVLFSNQKLNAREWNKFLTHTRATARTYEQEIYVYSNIFVCDIIVQHAALNGLYFYFRSLA